MPSLRGQQEHHAAHARRVSSERDGVRCPNSCSRKRFPTSHFDQKDGGEREDLEGFPPSASKACDQTREKGSKIPREGKGGIPVRSKRRQRPDALRSKRTIRRPIGLGSDSTRRKEVTTLPALGIVGSVDQPPDVLGELRALH